MEDEVSRKVVEIGDSAKVDTENVSQVCDLKVGDSTNVDTENASQGFKISDVEVVVETNDLAVFDDKKLDCSNKSCCSNRSRNLDETKNRDEVIAEMRSILKNGRQKCKECGKGRIFKNFLGERKKSRKFI